jgi:streptogramin lyase
MGKVAAAFSLAISVASCVVLPAAPVTRPASTCQPGATSARFDGKAVCLAPGAACDTKFLNDYPSRGYLCISGKLQKLPPVRALHLPPATPLPAKTATIRFVRKDLYSPDVGGLAASAHRIWIAGGLFAIDPANNAVSGPFTHAESQDVGAGPTTVWASDFDGLILRRFDARTGKLVASISLVGSPEGIVVTPGAVWVAEHHGGDVARIDPATNRVVAHIGVGPPDQTNGPQGIAYGLGSVWAGDGLTDEIDRIDPKTNEVTARIALPPTSRFTPCGGVAVGRTAVWMSSCQEDNSIAHIDPATNAVASMLTLPGEVDGMTAIGDDAWFVLGGDPETSRNAAGSLIELGPDDRVIKRIALGRGFVSGGVVNAFGSLWLSNWLAPVVLRVPL